MELGAHIDRSTGRGKRRARRATIGRRRRSTRRKVAIALVTLVVLVAGVAAGGYVYLRYRFDQFKKIHVAAEQAVAPGAPFNMLVIGSDSRVGLSGAAEAQAGSASLVGGKRSDVVMIWHVVPATKQINVLSIPRDTLVSMDGDQSQFGTFNRINSSFNSGPNLLVRTIEDNFGIPINHVLQVDFGGFTGAVNALGGVKMNFNYPAQDAFSGLDVTTTGCQVLNGTQALAVARSRHYMYYADGYWQSDPTSDLGRIQRQDEFLRALIGSAKSKLNPLTINAFLGSLPQGLVPDDQFNLNEVINLAFTFHSFSPTSLQTQTLPTLDDGYVSPWGDILFVDQPAAQQMLVSIFGNELESPSTPPPNTSLESTPPPKVTPTTAPPPTSTTVPSGTTTTTAPPYNPTPC